MHQQRIERLIQEVLAHGLDGLAIMPGPNMVYLSGIHAHVSERPIILFIPVDDEPAIIIPELEASKARAAGIPDKRIFSWNDDQGYTGAFQMACAQIELSDFLLGIEALHMRVLELELLQRYAPGLAIAHAEPIMNTLRQIKDDGELAAMSRAVVTAQNAMEKLLPRIHVGQSEKQIAAMLLQELTEAGSDAAAFPPIVSAGPNSASPHAIPTDRPLQSGDLLVIDWGAIVDDYPSDITRTFAIGDLEPELEQVYELVSQANEAARAVARPGASGRDLDHAAREVITAAGFGDYFIHRTGHGLGLEIHEHPYIMEANSEPLQAGNVFTIEPGIYLSGRGGVRIEDDIVITSDGSHSLTSFPRNLIRVGH
jgi:Xaa-Pro dipeptidase